MILISVVSGGVASTTSLAAICLYSLIFGAPNFHMMGGYLGTLAIGIDECMSILVIMGAITPKFLVGWLPFYTHSLFSGIYIVIPSA